MDLKEVVSYIWLGQAMFAMLPWRIDQEIEEMVRTGRVAYELVRPLDLHSLWFTRSMANLAAPVFLRAVPMFVVAGIFFGLELPASPFSAMAWFAATIGALILGSAFATLMSVSLFWTISGEGIKRLGPVSVYALSGMIVPLPLFPDWAQGVLSLLPFAGLIDTPFRLYTGHLPPGEILHVLSHQAAWSVVIILAGRYLLGRGIHRVVVQGG